MKADSTITKELKRLDQLMNHAADPLARRLAWDVFHAIRWAREDVKGWPRPSDGIHSSANLIRSELET